MLAINFLLKVIQAVILSMNTYEQEIIEVGNDNEKMKNKDTWNYCHHMPIFKLLGANNRLPLINMARIFIWIEETEELINSFEIGYIFSKSLHANKSFK